MARSNMLRALRFALALVLLVAGLGLLVAGCMGRLEEHGRNGAVPGVHVVVPQGGELEGQGRAFAHGPAYSPDRGAAA